MSSKNREQKRAKRNITSKNKKKVSRQQKDAFLVRNKKERVKLTRATAKKIVEEMEIEKMNSNVQTMETE